MVPVAVSLQKVTAISAGWRFSLAISGGTVSAWGWNELGQLGDAHHEQPGAGAGQRPRRSRGIAAGEQHSLALLHAGGLRRPRTGARVVR